MGIPELAMFGANVFAGKKAVDAASGGGGQDGGKKSAPPASDYVGAVREQAEQQRQLLNEQTQANRPNQSTPFASSQWSKGPDGQWQQTVSLNGGLGESSNALQNQLAEQMRVPLDFNSLPELGTGESARKQTSDAAYSQAASRLDPQWQQTEERNRTRLLNQGLAEGSEAYNKAMDRLSQQRNDAYNQANFSAIREGTAAGQALYNQNLTSRNQKMQELLTARRQPLSELQALQGFTGMPGFSQAGQGQAPNLLSALLQQDQGALMRWQMAQQGQADTIGGIMDLVGKLGPVIAMASDERVKTDVERLPEEVLPGVPLAVFRYLPDMNLPGLCAGVVAQDLQKVQPESVTEGEDGILYVGAEFAPVKIGE
jgi:hypothetical protein